MKSFLKKYEPMYLMETMQDELNKIIKDTFGEFELPETPIERFEKTWRPAVEITETEGMYNVKAELPGLEKEHIDVEVGEDSICIKAETKHKKEEHAENLYKSEFKYGKFLRTIPFPSKVRVSEAKAEYKDGILHVWVPKSEEEHKKVTKLDIN